MNNSSLSNKRIFLNSTGKLSEYFRDDGQCPRWIVYVFLALFFLGCCVNLLETFALLRSKRNGILSIIMQITLADTILFFVGLLELFSSYYQTWKFTSPTCMVYGGTDILANTLVAYLLVCLNFHVITFWNLHHVDAIKNNKNPLTNFSEGSSSECLVTRNETRMVTIDYRKRKHDVPVMFPMLFVWILCLSVSMPKYVLSSTVEVQGRNVCAIFPNSYDKILQSLLLVFSILIPCLLLLVSLIILLYKLWQKNIDNVLSKQFDEIRRLLIFSVTLTSFYMLTSFQKNIFSASATIEDFFIFENYREHFPNVYQTMLHYSGTSFRGILCYVAVPNVRRVIRDRILFCYNKET